MKEETRALLDDILVENLGAFDAIELRGIHAQIALIILEALFEEEIDYTTWHDVKVGEDTSILNVLHMLMERRDESPAIRRFLGTRTADQ